MQLMCTASFIGKLWLLDRFLLGFSNFLLVLSRSGTMWKTLPSTRDCFSNCVMTLNLNIVPCSFIHSSGVCLQGNFCPTFSFFARKLKCFLMYRKKWPVGDIKIKIFYLVDIFKIFNQLNFRLPKKRIQTCSATMTQ